MDPAAAGHFTTMQLRRGRVQGRDLHLARLVAASHALYGVVPDTSALRAKVRRALLDAGMQEGDCTLRVRIRAQAFASANDGLLEGGGEGAPADGGSPAARPATPLLIGIDIEPPRLPPAQPLRVRTHAGVRACAGIKHLAWDVQFEARRAAQAAGFDDALLVDADGDIAEGTFWNLVLLHGEGLVRPDGPALPGVTEQLLESALDVAGGPAMGRQPVRVADIGRFRAAWAINSTGIQDIASIDGHRFPGDADTGDLLRSLLAACPRQAL